MFELTMYLPESRVYACSSARRSRRQQQAYDVLAMHMHLQNVLIAIGSVFTAFRVAHSAQLAASNKVSLMEPTRMFIPNIKLQG
jgi:hypothetical protein